MMMILRLREKPGLDVTDVGDGSTVAASDIRGNHQRKQFLNVESVKLRNKINHKLRNITF